MSDASDRRRDAAAATSAELRERMARLGLTGVELAALLGVSAPQISYWRHGRRTDRRRGGEIPVVAPRPVLLLLDAWAENPELLTAARRRAGVTPR